MVVAPFTSQGEERPVSSNLEGQQSSATKGVGWLAPHRDTFLTELGRLGYAAKTIGDYLQDGRAGGERHLFVIAKAPHRPFASSLAVRRIRRHQRAGAPAPLSAGEV